MAIVIVILSPWDTLAWQAMARELGVDTSGPETYAQTHALLYVYIYIYIHIYICIQIYIVIYSYI